MKYLIIVVIVLLLGGCKQEDTVFNNINEMKIHEEYLVKDIVKTDDELLNADEIVIPDSTGVYYLKVKYKNKNKKLEKVLEYNVIDDISPRVFGSTNKIIYVGDETPLCDLITYGDNYDKRPACIVNGSFDIFNVGTYDIEYLIKDSSNNETKIASKLTVKEKPKENNNKNKTEKVYKNFSDVYKNYKNDNNEIGIDVSKWQDKIDFEKVKEAGASFVIMRIGIQSKKGVELTEDINYSTYIKDAKNAGLKVGVYLATSASSKKEVIEQVKWMNGILNGEKLELGISFDWENFSKWNTFNLSFYDINLIADTFIEEVNKLGYEGMLYSSKYYLENIWENKNNNTVWLAHYTDKTSYTGDYKIWQLCNNGKIDGIKGDVDIDILYN